MHEPQTDPDCAVVHDPAGCRYQEAMLPRVSRTFALTIPQLPMPLRTIVTNAYMLCRIADTIEDEPALSAQDKANAHARFLAVLRGEADARAFSAELAPRFSPATSRDEAQLVADTDKVTGFTRSLATREQEILCRCVTIMCHGMSAYQRNASLTGLRDLPDCDRYCYYVAGVVGEMLTELFTLHAPQARARREELMALAPSFGEGLQLTNLLKDVWEDRRQGACWLPRDLFAEHGVDLTTLQPDARGAGFAPALRYLISVAHGHLRDAMRYTLLLPAAEVGIRRFCLWAIGMAVLTLRRIHRRPEYTCGQEVKITRRQVKAVIAASNLATGHDTALRILFAGSAFGLPVRAQRIDPAVSDWHRVPALE